MIKLLSAGDLTVGDYLFIQAVSYQGTLFDHRDLFAEVKYLDEKTGNIKVKYTKEGYGTETRLQFIKGRKVSKLEKALK